MPTTLTLKNIPDDLYERLKTSAAAHRRSLNSEAIVCLENALQPVKRITAQDRVLRARALRSTLLGGDLTAGEIAGFKNEGRP